MKVQKGERWLIATRGGNEMEIKVLEDVLTHEDVFFKARILTGKRSKMCSFNAMDGPGDKITLRTILTTWLKALLLK